MKILHIWDQAGVACVLAKWQRKAGHDAQVIKTEANDPFGFLKFYGEQYVDSMTSNSKVFTEHDVFHLHSYRFIAKALREKYPKSKIILEYHGTDARCTDQKDRKSDEDVCDLILYSTPDLIEWVPNGIWLPLPIDTDHFKPSEHKSNQHIQPKMLFMKSNAYNRPKIEDMFTDITYLEPQPYSKLPEIFKDYDTYIDIQDHKENKRPIEAHSKTGLEALATGMKLYTHDRRFTSGLPVWHRPENVIKRLDYLYSIA